MSTRNIEKELCNSKERLQKKWRRWQLQIIEKTERYKNTLHTRMKDMREPVYQTEQVEAMSKQTAKKPIDRCMFSECTTCGNVEIQYCSYCPDCGQKLDWSERYAGI